MISYPITVHLPERLYKRLAQTAQAMRQPLDEVLVRAVEIGSPPLWEDVPAAFQSELAALDRLGDESLWQIARSRQAEDEMARYEDLLDKNADQTITPSERGELTQLREAADLFMLKKAQAAALLQWRGYQIPPAEKL
jgi:hypothetical protein